MIDENLTKAEVESLFIDANLSKAHDELIQLILDSFEKTVHELADKRGITKQTAIVYIMSYITLALEDRIGINDH